MNISEVRIKLILNRTDKLRAFCSITVDGAIVIRDLKIIEGPRGPFVAMPSRKLTDRCAHCGMKNHLRARFCGECGNHLAPNRAPKDPNGRTRVHADIAHPIHAEARAALEKRVLDEYRLELERSKQPGYKPVEIFDGEDYEE
ncbi:MAG: septation protein SpoVG family protein [Planctomycetes bacterium]|nr:septation protein SpoVG family protein [Planctomycetota bacterium]